MTQIKFEFVSNFNQLRNTINNGISQLSSGGSQLMKKIEIAGQSAFRFNALQQFSNEIQNSFRGIIESGIKLNTQLKETQAITGLSNKAMVELSNKQSVYFFMFLYNLIAFILPLYFR